MEEELDWLSSADSTPLSKKEVEKALADTVDGKRRLSNLSPAEKRKAKEQAAEARKAEREAAKTAVKPRSATKRPAALIKADAQLSVPQRLFKRFLVETSTAADAIRRMQDAGYTHRRETYYRWRQNGKFAKALQLEQDYQLKCIGLDKAKLLLDAEKIKEMALSPQPILYKGEHTGYTERELGAALRALEFQGRGVGIGVEDHSKVQVNIDIDFSGRVDSKDDKTFEGESETLSVR